jgi:hypothetical protein
VATPIVTNVAARAVSLIGNSPQRSEHGGTDDQCKEKLKARVRKLLPVSCRRAPLEVADLPQQCAPYGQLDRDRGLEELDRNVHGAPVSTAWRHASTESLRRVGARAKTARRGVDAAS